MSSTSFAHSSRTQVVTLLILTMMAGICLVGTKTSYAQNSAIGTAAAARGETYLGQPPADCGGFILKVFLTPSALIWMPSGQVQTWGDQLAQHPLEWIELPNDWYTKLQPGDICTIGHSGSTDPAAGHVWMVGWLNGQTDVLQASYSNRYAWRTTPLPPGPYTDPSGLGRYPVRCWRPLSPLSDGLYRAGNESTVFLVRRGIRRTIPSADCFNDWGLSWGAITVVDPTVLYSRTVAGLPIVHLVKTPSEATVYWIVEDTKSTPYRGHYIARPIASASVFNQMHFDWNDIRTVNYSPVQRYPIAMTLRQVEPRIVIEDGPFVNATGGTNFFGGYRARNLSDASTTGFAITIRAWRSDGWWMDFPWYGTGGLDKMKLDGVVKWAWTTVPSGAYSYAATYSYWVYQDGSWHNIQSIAHTDGEYSYPDNPGRGTFSSPQ